MGRRKTCGDWLAPSDGNGKGIFAFVFFPSTRAIGAGDSGRQDKNLDVMVGQPIKTFRSSRDRRQNAQKAQKAQKEAS